MTPIELRRKVLEKLQVIASGEPVFVADGQVVQSKYEGLHEILMHDDLVGWMVTEDIPAEYESVIIAMVAAECVNEFYCPESLKVAILSEGKYDLPAPLGPSVAERRIRKLSAPGFDGKPVQVEYF